MFIIVWFWGHISGCTAWYYHEDKDNTQDNNNKSLGIFLFAANTGCGNLLKVKERLLLV